MDVTFGDGRQGVFRSWKVREGTTVRTAAVLLAYSDSEGMKQVKASAPGVVQSLANLHPGDALKSGQFLLRLRQCEHPVVMKDLCADCGEDLRVKEGLPGERAVQTQARVAMIHHIPELQITPEEAKSYGTADERNLLGQRRLVLLVDLDQTLIHTTNEEVNPHLKDVFHFQLYGASSPWYHTRLRPHTRHFLDTVSKLYELHICTFGARLYAHTVAKILDPEATLFGHRILSREECFEANLKIANLKALFPCGDRLVCIIDDREDVWNFAPNVVHVKPYRFFKHTGDINAPPGFTKNGQAQEASNKEECKEPKTTDAVQDTPEESTTSQEQSDPAGSSSSESVVNEIPAPASAATTGESECPSPTDGTHDIDDDDYLYHLEDILTRIHTAFYQMYDQLPTEERPPDMKSVVPYVKNKVLQKCNIVFSGVVPTNVRIEASPIYKVAVAFGATVQTDVVIQHGKHRKASATTHLVAAKWGTAKVYQARKAGSAIKIVTPQWLWCCVERWERVDERLFLLTKENPVSESKRYGRRKDGASGLVVSEIEQATSAMKDDEIVEYPRELCDDQQGAAYLDLDNEPNAKRPKLEQDDNTNETPVSFSSQSSSSSSSSTGSQTENDEKNASATSGDEEIAEALERVFD